jgi:aprataxin and PNK-like factor
VNKDGMLKLVAKHANPCYYTKAGQTVASVLQKDQSCELSSGDKFSLLPDSLLFEVTAKISSNVEGKEKNGESSKYVKDVKYNNVSDVPDSAPNTKEREELPMETDSRTSPLTVKSDKETTKCEVSSVAEDSTEVTHKKTAETEGGSEAREEQNRGQSQAGDISEENGVSEKKGGVKTRNLPSWLLQDNPEPARTGRSKAGPTASKPRGKTTAVKAETSTAKTSKPATKRKPPSKRRAISDSDDDYNDEDTDDRTTAGQPKKKVEKADPVTTPSSPPPAVHDDSHDVHKSSDDTDNAKGKVESRPPHPKPLPPCPYGRSCYRKNPVHFQEYSHNFSSDEDENGSDSDSEKPECPYGTACYRKNAEHRRQYRHTAPPSTGSRRTTRTRKRSNKGHSVLDGESDDDSQPNTYDYNDSFIDDENVDDSGSDTSSTEDGNWLPSNSGSEEDVNDLAKEAADFIENKKMHK